MILVLQSPFKEIWLKGYLRASKDGRKRVDLVGKEGRTTVSYARYLLSVKLGRLLTENEEADHIDQDKTNDNIENLQVLTVEEHKIKTKQELSGLTMISCVCPHCDLVFERRLGLVGRTENTFCSRSCNAKHSRSQGKWGGKRRQVNPELLSEIRELRAQGLSDYKIADIVKINRSTIQRERKLNDIP